ncbi:hypothetical protein EVAR_24685_1 [Eumeta japonica]|uniref:Uncharacterized protein n=1 Tax=Eumeta variegata TaxID=151549 RepID=A0A4C1WEU7_EUMVA|nr:hypothetical protein EVAR_24685_1 [Eumeta japonica]
MSTLILYSNQGLMMELEGGMRATGEPATCLGIVVAFALREAITSSRDDSGCPKNEWFCIEGPYTNENMLLAANTRIEEFKLQ